MALINFSNQTDDEITMALTDKFSTEEEQQFVSHFKLFLAYGDDVSKFVVDVDFVWEWIGFSTKGNCKKSLRKYFVEGSDYIVNLLMPEDKQVHGGHNKEVILMNVDTFKGLCMLAGTARGKQTRKYYIAMENALLKYIKEKAERHRIALHTLQLQLDNVKNHHRRQQELERHRLLIEQNMDTSCLYVLKINEISPDIFDIKIGETIDIKTRMISHNATYNDPVLIDIFPCARAHQFEQYLLHRRDVQKQIIIGKKEEIHITQDFTYDMFVKIIKKNIDNFSGPNVVQRLQAKLLQERGELTQLIANTNDPALKALYMKAYEANIVASATNDLKAIDVDNDEQENIPISDRKVYKYQPKNLKEPIAQFYSLREAARSLNNPTIHDYHIRNACQNNTEFAGYRWFTIDGNEERPTEIPPTTEQPKEVSKRHKGYVAQLNCEKNKIINVFPYQKAIVDQLNIGSGRLSHAISHGKMAGNFYWQMYDDCDDNLKATFEGVLPEPTRVATCSKIIQRIDPETNEVLETYQCIQDVCNLFRTCHQQLHKVSKDESIFKGFKWRITSCVQG